MSTGPVYIVTGDADQIDDWTAATLFVALREQLAALGVTARWKPDDDGPCGLEDCPDDALAAKVDELVERTIGGGTTDAVVVLQGAIVSLAALRRAMDPGLLDAIERSQDFISPQRLVDSYCAAHRAKFGTDFGVA